MIESAPKNQERIAKRIAHLGYCSRRDAEKLILQKKVKVNDTLIETPAFLVSKKDQISIDDIPLKAESKTQLYLYYKPNGLVCSSKDEKGRATIYDYLPKNLPRLVYVGRLDLTSEGLLLLTNNGELANLLSSPSLGLKRTYKVRAYGKIEQKQLDDLALGISIEGIHYQPIIANILRRNKDNVWIEFVLKEGKNREIRIICEHLGLQVNRLIRTSFGTYSIDGMNEGDIKEMGLSSLEKMFPKKALESIGIRTTK
ncbi:MAG: rRNA pseudouridine synthase [Alphaproteobacteria bacterium]|jgi:23S rRNA pseudouridine2605 synthase|nr:rRNA pseudouridine synthase [Alphaproteobacteria bacterium]